QGLPPRRQQLADLRRRLVDDAARLDVDLARRLLATATLLAHAAQKAGAAAVVVEEHAPQPAHAELGDHAPGDVVGLLDVAGRPGGDLVVEDDLLGDGAAQADLDLALQLRARHQVAVVVGAAQDVAADADAARDDRDLVHRVGVGQRAGDQGVAGL